MSTKKPVWTEGLFITEHHLQQQDRYHEGRLEERLATGSRANWGLMDLQIDMESLGRGQFAL
ncbi:MAG TPA: type VI secretion system baseplate subunit TssK, partial [Polyangiaceae bacterium]|nr:type VI secretion system baseplate subunit TssK [Polyangiaceae bacterium]